MQDGGKAAAGRGAYFHVVMMNGNANQLSEMVPIAVIQEELGRYINAEAIAYILVNSSEIRPVVMTTRALIETAWDGVSPGTSDADGAYYRRWATEEFGARSAHALAAIYKEYFAAPSLRSSFAGPGLTSAGNAPPPTPQFSGVKRVDGDSIITRRFGDLSWMH